MEPSFRPTLHRINADSSWLLTLPVPPVTNSYSDEIPTITLLIDPWLAGPQVDYHKMFSSQEHTTEPQFDSVAQLATYLKAQNPSRSVDAVVIAHEFSDHLHKTTLEGIDTHTPFLAVPRAAHILRSWGKKPVTKIPADDGSLAFISIFKETPLDFYSKAQMLDLRFEYVGTTKPWYKDIIGARLHGCLVISFLVPVPNSHEVVREAIVYTPHGLPQKDFLRWKNTSVTGRQVKRVLAVLAGWDEISNPWWLGGPLNLGLPNNVSLFSPPHGISPTSYFIRTHDEHKSKTGLVGRVLKRKEWTETDVAQALERHSSGKHVRVMDMSVGEKLELS